MNYCNPTLFINILYSSKRFHVWKMFMKETRLTLLSTLFHWVSFWMFFLVHTIFGSTYSIVVKIEVWGCASSKLMMSTKFVQFWNVVRLNMWKKRHVFTCFWPFMICNFMLYRFQVLMLYGIWYTKRFSSLMWIILWVSKSMFKKK